MTLNNIKCQLISIHCSVISVLRVVTKQPRLESRGFRYKVTTYLSYLRIKFYDEIKRIPSNFKHNFRFAGVER